MITAKELREISKRAAKEQVEKTVVKSAESGYTMACVTLSGTEEVEALKDLGYEVTSYFRGEPVFPGIFMVTWNV